MSQLKQVTIYTDGACIDNPGPGGYAAVLLFENRRKEIVGGFRKTTNNRMEIMAAIAGLKALKFACKVTLYTDSQYLQNAIMEGWAKRWRANGWMRNRKDKARNHDLWEQLLNLCATHQVIMKWVKGHAGNLENERCDVLSVAAALGSDLPVDVGYENETAPASELGMFG